MKRLVAVILVVGILVVLCAPVAQGAEEPLCGSAPFRGCWTSIDLDGSFQRLWIGRGVDRVRFLYRDDGCTACGTDGDGNPLYPCVGVGRGTVDGDELTGSLALWCLGRPGWLYDPALPVAWTYNADDTLTGWYGGTVWNRAPGGCR